MKIQIILMLLIFVKHGAVNAYDKNSPFSYACKADKVRTQHLNSGFLSNKIPLKDTYNKVSTFDLVKSLTKIIAQRISGTKILLDNIKFCLNNGSNKSCRELNHWFKYEISKYIKEARFHLSLSQSANNVKSWLSMPEKTINTSMSVWSFNKEFKWDPLTLKEKRKSKRTLANYVRRTVKESESLIVQGSLKKSERKRFISSTLLSVRYRHYLKYQMLMGQVHFLQYIKSANPSLGELKRAFLKLEKNLMNEKKYILAKMKQTSSLNSATISHSFLDVLDYSSVLEQFLILSPEYCNLGASLLTYRDRRGLKIALAVGLPLSVGAFFVSPAVALVGGIALGAGFALHSQLNLNFERNRNYSHVYGDRFGFEGQKVSTAKKYRDFDVALLPIGFGIFSGTVSKIGLNTLKHSSKLSTTLTRRNVKYYSIKSIIRIKKLYSSFRIKQLTR